MRFSSAVRASIRRIRAAADGRPVRHRDEERAAVVGDLVRVEPEVGGAFFRIGAQQLGVERTDERSGHGRAEILAANQHVGVVEHADALCQPPSRVDSEPPLPTRV
jgi:hypothetical protein